MESHMSWLAAAAIGFVLSLYFLRRGSVFKSRAVGRYPPGPKGLPLIGNVSIPKTNSWVTYREWSEQYSSDLIGLSTLGAKIVILNSFQSASDLLDKRSSIYSDRPRSGMTMCTELCGFAWALTLLPYDNIWREGRKAFHREFQQSVVPKYRPGELLETRKLLIRLLNTPDQFTSHLRLLIGSEIVRITYGVDVNDAQDPYIKLSELAMYAAKRTAIPGSYLVDIIPVLKYLPEWFPGATFKQEARLWRTYAMDLYEKPFAAVQKQMAVDPGAATDCITKSLLEGLNENSVDVSEHEAAEHVAKTVAGTMYVAGSDTAYSALVSFVLAMVIHTDVQRLAQAEIDEVCYGRLPDFSDYEALPYVHALVKETLRWNPVAPLGLPHRCMQDDIYEGYFIPEGTMLIANIWAMCNDEEIYPEASTFKPERFLKRSGPGEHPLVLNPDVRDPADIVFGFGRRICPGQYMAYDSMWIAIVSVLSVFDVLPVKDADGEDVVPPFENEPGFIIEPKHFKCRIIPRSPAHETVIRDAEASQ